MTKRRFFKLVKIKDLNIKADDYRLELFEGLTIEFRQQPQQRDQHGITKVTMVLGDLSYPLGYLSYLRRRNSAHLLTSPGQVSLSKTAEELNKAKGSWIIPQGYEYKLGQTLTYVFTNGLQTNRHLEITPLTADSYQVVLDCQKTPSTFLAIEMIATIYGAGVVSELCRQIPDLDFDDKSVFETSEIFGGRGNDQPIDVTHYFADHLGLWVAKVNRLDPEFELPRNGYLAEYLLDKLGLPAAWHSVATTFEVGEESYFLLLHERQVFARLSDQFTAGKIYYSAQLLTESFIDQPPFVHQLLKSGLFDRLAKQCFYFQSLRPSIHFN